MFPDKPRSQSTNIPKIIYEDDALLALDKPPFLVVEESPTVSSKALSGILQKEFNIQLDRGGIVHRLDKDTSGIILVAKTQEALENLQHQFKMRLIQKEYLLLSHGWMLENQTVTGAIARNPHNREKFSVVFEGKEAVTELIVVKRLVMSKEQLISFYPDFNNIQMRKLAKQKYAEFSLILARPKTGRTHQIRVHLKYIGYPIVSDEKYGGRKIYRLDKRWCPRQFLHAQKIAFEHPISKKWLELISPLPDDLKTSLGYLDTYE